jgi:DNA-binding IclR family transcriptional regulator
LRVTIEKGRTQPLYAGASSKLLLAFMDESQWDLMLDTPLESLTATTITEPGRLLDQLHQIRQQGYAVSDGEIDVGARAVAVPIRDGHGEVIAALSIEGPGSRMADDTLMQYLEMLLEEADLIYQEFS